MDLTWISSEAALAKMDAVVALRTLSAISFDSFYKSLRRIDGPLYPSDDSWERKVCQVVAHASAHGIDGLMGATNHMYAVRLLFMAVGRATVPNDFALQITQRFHRLIDEQMFPLGVELPRAAWEELVMCSRVHLRFTTDPRVIAILVRYITRNPDPTFFLDWLEDMLHPPHLTALEAMAALCCQHHPNCWTTTVGGGEPLQLNINVWRECLLLTTEAPPLLRPMLLCIASALPTATATRQLWDATLMEQLSHTEPKTGYLPYLLAHGDTASHHTILWASIEGRHLATLVGVAEHLREYYTLHPEPSIPSEWCMAIRPTATAWFIKQAECRMPLLGISVFLPLLEPHVLYTYSPKMNPWTPIAMHTASVAVYDRGVFTDDALHCIQISTTDDATASSVIDWIVFASLGQPVKVYARILQDITVVPEGYSLLFRYLCRVSGAKHEAAMDVADVVDEGTGPWMRSILQHHWAASMVWRIDKVDTTLVSHYLRFDYHCVNGGPILTSRLEITILDSSSDERRSRDVPIHTLHETDPRAFMHEWSEVYLRWKLPSVWRVLSNGSGTMDIPTSSAFVVCSVCVCV